MSRERANVRAGLFVAAGGLLMIAVILVLADFDRWLTPMQRVRASFSLADGLKGLKEGSTVTIGGTPKGSVVGIADRADERGVVVASIVEFAIPAEYTIYENAHLELREPLIGGNTMLNIRSFGGPAAAGRPSGAGWEYEHGVDPPIAGGVATSDAIASAVRELGIEERQRAQVRRIIANLDNLAAALGEEPKPIRETIANIHAITAALRDDLPPITASVKDATADLKAIAADARGRSAVWFERIDAITVRTDRTLATVEEMLAEYRPMLSETLADARRAMADAEQLTDHARTEWVARVDSALSRADEAMGNVREATAEVRALVTAQRPVLERTLANIRITADQLKLASIEVRRAPWRLLYQPTDKELETDNLYDAARSFAVAADSLNSTADSLRAIVERYGQDINSDDPNLKLMLDNLHQTFEQFNKAEEQFWSALNRTAPPAE